MVMRIWIQLKNHCWNIGFKQMKFINLLEFGFILRIFEIVIWDEDFQKGYFKVFKQLVLKIFISINTIQIVHFRDLEESTLGALSNLEVLNLIKIFFWDFFLQFLILIQIFIRGMIRKFFKCIKKCINFDMLLIQCLSPLNLKNFESSL